MYGRDPDQIKILAGLPVYAWFHAAQRRTQALARDGG